MQSLAEMQGIEPENTPQLRSISLLLAIVAIGILVISLTAIMLPSHAELASLRERLRHTEEQLAKAKKEEEQARNHLKWMQDPEYAEQIARDKANQALPFETIIRFQKPPVPQQSPKTTEKTP